MCVQFWVDYDYPHNDVPRLMVDSDDGLSDCKVNQFPDLHHYQCQSRCCCVTDQHYNEWKSHKRLETQLNLTNSTQSVAVVQWRACTLLLLACLCAH